MEFFKKKSLSSIHIDKQTSSLEKNLSAIDLILLGLGGIIGTGVFALTGLVASEYSGPAIMLSYGIAGFTCIFVALVYTELATMISTSGSIYTYSYVAYGEVIAWLIGGLVIVEFGVASSAVAGSWSAYVQGVLQSAGISLPVAFSKTPFEGGILNLPAIFIVLFVGFMLYRGNKETKAVNTILVLIKILAIAVFIFFAAPEFDATNWKDFMPYGFNNVLYGSSILFFAFTGFAILASAAEECKNPKRDLSIAIMGSLVISTVIYIVVGGLITGIVPYNQLNNAQPLAYALRVHGNSIGSTLVATGAIAGMTSVIMINIYAVSRVFYVIARDGLLPKRLSHTHDKYKSPYILVCIFTIFVALLASLVPYSYLAQFASMAALTDYTIIGTIVMVFRFRYKDIERPFKCPAIFVVAPFAIISALYLLFKQIIDDNGNWLLTGKIYMLWFAFIFIMYVIKKALTKQS